ncbi:MAG: GTP-binding protein [Candidatus Marinimicrobia bacterium]|nr:GTP-binding protein [Candidatus Neomarinimicrobiota bacterium]
MGKNIELDREQMNIVIAGHVDHGKSTIIGRMLADTNSLPEGKLEQVKRTCEMNSKPFEYAFLLDALKDEQSQGITIDSARVFFKTKSRDYIIIDAPGHIEFLKNMVTGASRAESALLVIDANEGVKENSRRHGYMIAMLGITQIAVIVNKMDLIDYDEDKYKKIINEYTKFLKSINITAKTFIPVSGKIGDNIASISDKMKWYSGRTVLGILDGFKKEKSLDDKAFRMPVQGIYKFTSDGDDRRIVSGLIETGKIKIGDEIIFYPSGKSSKIKTIEEFNTPKQETAEAGKSTGFTLDEQIYIKRGEVASKLIEKKPKITSRILVSIFWMGKEALSKNKEYYIKIGTVKVAVKLEEIKKIIDASNLDLNVKKEQVERHDVAEVVLKLNRAIAFDLADEIATMSRFVIIDDYEIRGGGIIKGALEDNQAWVRDNVMLRNFKWEKSKIQPERRAEKYSQKSSLIILTGKRNSDKKIIAKELEAKLFEDGKIVYFLGIGNVLYGVDADIKTKKGNTKEDRQEHIRRLAEVAHILLDSGVILIITAIELTQDDLEIIKTIVAPDKINTIWIGNEISTDILSDNQIEDGENPKIVAEEIKQSLQEMGIIFKPW